MTPHSTRCLVAELPGTPTEWATLAGGLGARSAASNSAGAGSGTAAAVPPKSIPEDVLRAQKNFWGQTDTHGLRSIQVQFLGFKDDGVSEKRGLDRERIKSMVQRTVADA
jgi:hypothetical protein